MNRYSPALLFYHEREKGRSAHVHVCGLQLDHAYHGITVVCNSNDVQLHQYIPPWPTAWWPS
jgi:hypothetical protein